MMKFPVFTLSRGPGRRYALPLVLASLLSAVAVLHSSVTHGDAGPADLIETTVDDLLTSFAANRDRLANDRRGLFNLVDEVVGPAFDFNYISKLVLAKNWKKASDQQKKQFAREFRRLMIVTYATALFRYEGNEAMAVGETSVREKKGVQLATVETTVTLNAGNTVPVVYQLIDDGSGWKVYNLVVANLNIVLNYRSVMQSTLHSEGLDGAIASMKANNDRQYQIN